MDPRLMKSDEYMYFRIYIYIWITLKFNEYIHVIYPTELEIKDTTDAPKLANYLDIRLEF